MKMPKFNMLVFAGSRRRRWAPRTACGVAVAITALIAVAGCTTPPPGAAEAFEAAESRVRAIEGVESVETSLSEWDMKDRPGEWMARMHVIAATPDLDIAPAVAEAVGTDVGAAGVDLAVDLTVPAGPRLVAGSVDPRDSSAVATVDSLRSVAGVARVDAVPGSLLVALTDTTSFSDAAARIRPWVGAAGARLSRGDSTVGLTPVQPGTALLAQIDALAADPSTARLHYEVGGFAQTRPSLDVVSADASRVAAISAELAATADEAADSGVTPRARFSVSDEEHTGTEQGFIGLPLGSPEPGDLVATAPVLTPEEDAVREASVRAFLEESVAATGVPAEVTTRLEECSEGKGTRARADVLVPVFERYDSAQEPFDAVTAGWTAEGFTQVDRTMGRDYWAAQVRRDDGVRSTSIRGTTEGLSLSVESRCGAE